MTIKRAPQLRGKDQFKRYAALSKADIVEAFRDLFREYGGVDELDDTEWLIDLERRVALLKHYRTFDNEPDVNTDTAEAAFERSLRSQPYGRPTLY
jgi:hypothetical protein